MTRTPAITAADDRFHFSEMGGRWWETETCWFSFYHAERRLGGWLYMLARPNIGTVAGGAWVWDDTAHLPWEILYNANYSAMRLPTDADLADVALPTGVRIKVLESLQLYQLGFEDGDRIRLALQFEAVMAPVALGTHASGFGALGHFDQFGRVTGTLDLRGESIAIDCLAMRDRSWGPRPEHRPRMTSYVTAMADPGHGFLVMTNPDLPGEPITHGFYLREGEVSTWVSGHRQVQRNPQHGWMERISIQGVDARGRTLTAIGTAVSRIFINRHTFVDCNSLVRWQIDGHEAWGEDQDIWPVHAWADMRRAQKACAQPVQGPR